MRGADELAHQIKHQSQQQAGDYAPFVYGHVASYDPKTHSIRAVLPSMRDEADNPVLSSWMPLGASMAGNGIGLQMAPLGGATIENPTAGELVKISRFDRSLGVGFVDGFMFNQVAAPPVQDLKGGEVAIVAKGGVRLLLRENGHLEIEGTLVSVRIPDGAFLDGVAQKLVNETFVQLFNTHTHPVGVTNTNPPSQTMGAGELTTALEAQ